MTRNLYPKIVRPAHAAVLAGFLLAATTFAATTPVILSIDPKSWEIRKAVVHDQFENTVTMRFSKMVVNSGLPERTFTFVAPKGVAIVPLR